MANIYGYEVTLPDGWDAGAYGDTLICPCGDEIELDGQCPEGCTSPLPI